MEYLNRAFGSIKRKPLAQVFITLIYLFTAVMIKWKFHMSLSPALFIFGGIIGIYAIEIAESMVKIEPSPFKTPLFYYAFILLSFFVLTSSGSFLASGLVISIYLSLIFEKFEQIKTYQLGDVTSKSTLGPLPTTGTTGFIIVLGLGFIIETIILVVSHAL
jgi:hypothetical protein